eukprot:5740992-Amphidinium_carterae.1
MRIAYLAHDRADAIGLAESAKTLAQHMQQPRGYHMSLAKRVGRYLLGCPIASLRFWEQPMPTHLEVWCDADWNGDPITWKSTSGCCLRLGAHSVKSSSTLQSLVSLSVGEAEFYSLVKAAAVGLSAQSLMEEFGLSLALVVKSDSTAAQSLASRLGVARTKHMQSRWLWVQERVQQGHLEIKYQPTKTNVSDVMTKPVPRATLDCHTAGLCLHFGATGG